MSKPNFSINKIIVPDKIAEKYKGKFYEVFPLNENLIGIFVGSDLDLYTWDGKFISHLSNIVLKRGWDILSVSEIKNLILLFDQDERKYLIVIDKTTGEVLEEYRENIPEYKLWWRYTCRSSESPGIIIKDGKTVKLIVSKEKRIQFEKVNKVVPFQIPKNKTQYSFYVWLEGKVFSLEKWNFIPIKIIDKEKVFKISNFYVKIYKNEAKSFKYKKEFGKFLTIAEGDFTMFLFEKRVIFLDSYFTSPKCYEIKNLYVTENFITFTTKTNEIGIVSLIGKIYYFLDWLNAEILMIKELNKRALLTKQRREGWEDIFVIYFVNENLFYNWDVHYIDDLREKIKMTKDKIYFLVYNEEIDAYEKKREWLR